MGGSSENEGLLWPTTGLHRTPRFRVDCKLNVNGAGSVTRSVKPSNMSNTVTIERGFAGSFKQLSGRSRPGVDWAIQISGARSGVVVVRTYFSSNPPQETERKALADKAVIFVQKKLEEGWVPWAGVLEVE